MVPRFPCSSSWMQHSDPPNERYPSARSYFYNGTGAPRDYSVLVTGTRDAPKCALLPADNCLADVTAHAVDLEWALVGGHPVSVSASLSSAPRTLLLVFAPPFFSLPHGRPPARRLLGPSRPRPR